MRPVRAFFTYFEKFDQSTHVTSKYLGICQPFLPQKNAAGMRFSDFKKSNKSFIFVNNLFGFYSEKDMAVQASLLG